MRGGTYKAVLARNSGNPWPLVAESEPFTVTDLSEMVKDAADDIRVLIGQRPELGPKFGTLQLDYMSIQSSRFSCQLT